MDGLNGIFWVIFKPGRCTLVLFMRLVSPKFIQLVERVNQLISQDIGTWTVIFFRLQRENRRFEASSAFTFGVISFPSMNNQELTLYFGLLSYFFDFFYFFSVDTGAGASPLSIFICWAIILLISWRQVSNFFVALKTYDIPDRYNLQIWRHCRFQLSMINFIIFIDMDR